MSSSPRPSHASPADGGDAPSSEDAPKAWSKALRSLARWSKWRQAALRAERREAQRRIRAAAAGAASSRRPSKDGEDA